MSRVLTISDSLYGKLEEAARRRGFQSVERLLETWQADAPPGDGRAEAVDRINALRDRLFTIYGEMSDSAELVREDRMR